MANGGGMKREASYSALMGEYKPPPKAEPKPKPAEKPAAAPAPPPSTPAPAEAPARSVLAHTFCSDRLDVGHDWQADAVHLFAQRLCQL